MFSDTTLFFISIACVSFLVIMLIILLAATRMKGGGVGWAAVIIVITTVPGHLINVTHDYYITIYPASFFTPLFIPSIWFFAHAQMDKSFRFTTRSLLHTIPAFILLITTSSLLAGKMESNRVWEFMFLRQFSLIICFCQLVAYCFALFFYCRKRLKYLDDNYSDSDYIEIKWTIQFLILFFVAFLSLFLVYIINPRTEGLTWIAPVLNVSLMAYLVYVAIFHSTTQSPSRLSDSPERDGKVGENGHKNRTTSVEMSTEQMKDICDKIVDYLQNSKAYTNPDFSINMLSQEIGLHPKNISLAINGYLHRNFFGLINEMRIEEVKRLLRNPAYTVDGIFLECGFRSRSSFYPLFKKIEGITPAQWQKNNT